MLTRKTVLLAKIETTYGTVPAMTGADAVLISNLDISVDPNILERDNYHDSISAYGTRVGRKLMTCSFDVELKGNGAQPTLLAPIEQDAILRACGLVATEEADHVSYSPTSVEANMASVSLRFNLDGMDYIIRGAYGNMSINMVAGAFGVMSFTFTGLYQKPTDVAQLQPTYTNDTEPPIVESLSYAMDSYGGCPETWNYDMGNEVSERPCINADEGLEGLRITGRNGVGNVDPEMVSIATKDFWAIFEASNQVAVQGTIGTAVGNQFIIKNPTVQIQNIGIGDRNGLRTYEIEYLAVGDDNEFELECY